MCTARAETLAVPADVTDAEAVGQFANRALERFGPRGVGVNDAAVALFGRLKECPHDELRKMRRVIRS